VIRAFLAFLFGRRRGLAHPERLVLGNAFNQPKPLGD